MRYVVDVTYHHYGVEVEADTDDEAFEKACEAAWQLDADETKCKVVNSKEILATKLVNFAKNYDFYHYQDTLEVGETDEDAIKRTVTELDDPKCVARHLQLFTNLVQDDLPIKQLEDALDIVRSLADFLK